MTRILFSNPPWWVGQNANGGWTAGVRAGSRWPFTLGVRSQPGRLVLGDYVPYPFFLGFAASYVRQQMPDVEVYFRDSIALREGYQGQQTGWGNYLKDLNPDFIVIESATPSWEHDSVLIRSSERFQPHRKIIIAGPIAASRGAEILAEHPNVVACCKGEYEKGVVRVLRGERGVIDFDFLTPAEMNAAPPPWMDDEHAHLYYDSNPRMRQGNATVGQPWPQLQAWTSRGCWAKCCFCSWPATMTGNDPDGHGKRTVRHYSGEYLYRHLSDAVAHYGYQGIYLDDDLFNTSDRHVLESCAAIKRIGLPWSAMCRADTINASTWETMRDSGCFGVKVGMESGSQYVLDEIVNKRLDLGEAVETLRLLKSLGMTVHTTWTVGLPGETPAQQRETVALIQRLYDERLHTTHQLSGAAALEGTPLGTLLQVGKLDRFPGANTEGFDATSDGMRKLQRMTQR